MSEENSGGNAQNVDLGTLAESVKALNETVNGLASNFKVISDSQSQVLEKLNQPAVTPPIEDEKPVDVNLETISRTDFMQHIMDSVGKVVEEAVKPVKESTESIRSDFSNNQIKQTIRGLREGAHPDIDEWAPELKEILTQTPSLSLERAMRIAKAENPEKVKKIQEGIEAKKEQQKQEDYERRKRERPNFGGLTPQSSKTESSQRMSQEEAIESAWEEVSLQLEDPSILINSS